VDVPTLVFVIGQKKFILEMLHFKAPSYDAKSTFGPKI
jgi:hypothetical protein